MTIALAPGDCFRCRSPLERGELRCALCGQSVPAVEASTQQAGEGDRAKAVVKVHRCRGCGAAVAYDIRAKAPRCAFCGSVVEVESVTDPMEQTELYLPFTVDRDEARAALERWLATKRGFFTPSDLKQESTIESLRLLWWVGWLVDVDADIYWTADSDAGSRQSDWAPHSGRVPHARYGGILVPATRGLTEREAFALLGHYRGDTASTDVAAMAATDGATIEQFEVSRSQARKQVLERIESIALHEVAEREVPGSRTRNVKVSCLLRGLSTRRYAFPAHVLAYRYKDRLHRVVINGQDASCVHGTVPKSVWKQLLAALLVLVPAAALVAHLLLSR